MPEELAGRYRAALSRWEAVESLATRASLSAREVELLRNGERGAARNALGLARTEIAAQKRGWEEELEIQEIQLKRARGTLARAVAQRDLAGAIVSRNDRLNGRIKGAVSVEEITKAEAEQKVAEGEILVRQADVEEAETRIRQLKRRIADLPNLSPTPPASKQE